MEGTSPCNCWWILIQNNQIYAITTSKKSEWNIWNIFSLCIHIPEFQLTNHWVYQSHRRIARNILQRSQTATVKYQPQLVTFQDFRDPSTVCLWISLICEECQILLPLAVWGPSRQKHNDSVAFRGHLQGLFQSLVLPWPLFFEGQIWFRNSKENKGPQDATGLGS